MFKKIFRLLDDAFEEMIQIRRHLHQYPELSFQEKNTVKLIADYYRNLGVPVRMNVGGGGVVALIKGGRPGKRVALRADFDALPIQDEKNVPYKSKIPGVMHACGHDGHTALLLSLAKVLHIVRDELEGEYIMIHQHAEELAPGGAKAMIEDGCLEGVDAIFGTHLWITEPVGKILYKSGPVMASADHFKITVRGKGGHGAYPHSAIDPIVAASHLVIALQQIVSRRIDPLEQAVVTVGKFVADGVFNVIGEKAVLEGTVRTFNENIRTFIEKEIDKITKGIGEAFGCTIDYEYLRGYPAVINHPEETVFLAEIAKDIPGVTDVCETTPHMGGEDFSYYLQEVKGTFFFTGAMPEDPEYQVPHHHPKFDINEEAMLIAAKTLASAAIQYQHKEKREPVTP